MKKSQSPTESELQALVSRAFEDHQNGFLSEARDRYLQLLKYFPEVPVLHYNLGLIHYEHADYNQAKDSFGLAAGYSPQDQDILFNLALSLKKIGDHEGAINTFTKVVAGDPQSVDTLYNLAGCYREVHRYNKAVDTYLKLIKIAPGHASAHNNLAYVYHLVGDKDQALSHYNRVLELNPDHDSAKHMVAALSGREVSSSPDSYVADVFDNYSKTYDHSLVQELEYCVPVTLRGLLDRTQQTRKRFRHGFDLGCGTGLGAEAFGDIIEVFDGIDLSEKMIAIAAEKSIYRRLYCRNINDFLGSTEEEFDFFLAADVFAYVGDLKETFTLLRKRAKDHALFCFSTEKNDGEGYRLQESGRFAHSLTYIEELAGITSWGVVDTKTEGLRKEKGAWVKGELWVLQVLAE